MNRRGFFKAVGKAIGGAAAVAVGLPALAKETWMDNLHKPVWLWEKVAGFSGFGTYQGTGGTQTIGHGLGFRPSFIMIYRGEGKFDVEEIEKPPPLVTMCHDDEIAMAYDSDTGETWIGKKDEKCET